MYINPEDVARARSVSIFDYLLPSQLERWGNNNYRLVSDHSVKINANGEWYWWSEQIGGRNALDYMIKVEQIDFQEAVKKLLNGALTLPEEKRHTIAPKPQKAEEKNLALPEKNKDNNKVREYLTVKRGIEPHIVDYCINNGLIYEACKYNNAVFVGMNEVGEPAYASLRGTMPGSNFKGDAPGSDKQFSFAVKSLNPDYGAVEVFEAAIDALSYASWLSLGYNNGESQDKDFWRQTNYLSLGGVYKEPEPKEGALPTKKELKIPAALEKFIEMNPQIHTVNLHLDNDDVGRGAVKLIIDAMQEKFPNINVVDYPITSEYDSPSLRDVKDWNEYLIEWRKETGMLIKVEGSQHDFSNKKNTSLPQEEKSVQLSQEYEIEMTSVATKRVKVRAGSLEEAMSIAKEGNSHHAPGFYFSVKDLSETKFTYVSSPDTQQRNPEPQKRYKR